MRKRKLTNKEIEEILNAPEPEEEPMTEEELSLIHI